MNTQKYQKRLNYELRYGSQGWNNCRGGQNTENNTKMVQTCDEKDIWPREKVRKVGNNRCEER